ncbi:hypothetical protein Q6346_00050 [Isoptericola sp. b490]|uniref:hypothetical protein n=1 Tax=Actinotalea lenta TaxID=3064654 RepID=UPI00271235F0|nr:hypothetical protein [Isoptericola sp. b490]MDO8119699.1 hypothetical protein [Isoptericola sp. b490]
MKAQEVDFRAPVFSDHPDGWRSPADLAEGFLLAWALELRERRRIDAFNPFGAHVLDRLPPMFRYDTLGQLVRLPVGSAASPSADLTRRGRLTTLSIVWALFDELNAQWRLAPGDFAQYAETLSFATGGVDRPSVFRELSADLAKCLLSDRIQRASQGSDDLTDAERWFVTGDGAVLAADARGYRVIPFVIGGNYVPIIVTDDSFVMSVWSTARVLVESDTPDACIDRYGYRTDVLLEILEEGAVLAERRWRLPPAEAWSFNPWPGWPGGQR